MGVSVGKVLDGERVAQQAYFLKFQGTTKCHNMLSPLCQIVHRCYLGMCWRGLGGGREGEGPCKEGGAAVGGGFGFLTFSKNGNCYSKI